MPARELDEEIDVECGVCTGVRDWYLLRGEMADNVGKRERSLGSRVLASSCCEFV